MPLARVQSVAVVGLDPHPVDVEVDVSSGLPHFVIAGLPDTALEEAKNRVRSALTNSGLGFPMCRIVANLSPATLRKAGSMFDLAIAVGLLIAQGVVSEQAVRDVVLLGELSLDGRLRHSAGILPAVLGARDGGAVRVMVPQANAAEAALVHGVEILGVTSIGQAASCLGARVAVPEVEPIVNVDAGSGEVRSESPADLADVVGQPEAVRALVLAAAGRHHMLAIGPPGAGKSLLMARLPGILPDLTEAEALTVTAIHSLAGTQRITSLMRRPPLEAPHHSATLVALVGGGSGVVRPGAVSRASHGVLFLDEATEFPRAVLDSLRQCLETGEVTIHRAAQTARFPARFQLMLAANPCPCGLDGVVGGDCRCAASVRRRYLSRLSGPMLDRVDIQLRIPRVAPAALLEEPAPGSLTTERARHLVEEARAAAAERLHGTMWRVNADVPGSFLRGRLRVPGRIRASLDHALERGLITMRGYDRCLRVAWTAADLAGRPVPAREDIAEALYMRRAAA